MSDPKDEGKSVRRGVGTGPATSGESERLENALTEYKVLVETSAALSSGGGLQETLQAIARLVAQRLDAAWCDLCEREPDGGGFVVVARHESPEPSSPTRAGSGARRPESRPDLDDCIAERRAVVRYRDDPALTVEETARMDASGELSGMSVPLAHGGEVIGLIEVGENRAPRRWGEDDRRVLQAVADQAAAAFVIAGGRARLAEQAGTDQLTGLLNTGHFGEYLRHEVAVSRRFGLELSVLAILLDDFPAFAARHGRAPADRALVEIAGVLRAATRADVDVVARSGTDEFLVILPQARANGPEPTAARNVAERIRVAVAVHRFEGASGTRDAELTVSVGAAGVGLGGHSAEDLLSSAGNAARLARHGGKDRVVVFGT